MLAKAITRLYKDSDAVKCSLAILKLKGIYRSSGSVRKEKRVHINICVISRLSEADSKSVGDGATNRLGGLVDERWCRVDGYSRALRSSPLVLCQNS